MPAVTTFPIERETIMLRATMFRIKVLFPIAIYFTVITPIAAQSSGRSAKELNDFFTQAKLSAYCNYTTTAETEYILGKMRKFAVRSFGKSLAKDIDEASSERTRFIIDGIEATDLSCGVIADRILGTAQAIKEHYANERERD